MPRSPPDRDQVARHVRTTLATEDNVMESGVFHVLPADPAARAVAVQHEGANTGRHQMQPLEF